MVSRTSRQILLSLWLLVGGVEPLNAAPPPLLLFVQQVSIPAAEKARGELVGVTLLSANSGPADQDRYRAFRGQVQVARKQTGLPPQVASLDDAVNKHQWLEIAGAGSQNSFHVRVLKPARDVEYVIDVRETTLAIPSAEVSAEMQDSFTFLENQKRTWLELEEVRRLSHLLGASDIVNLQEQVETLISGNADSASQLERAFVGLRAALTRMAADPNARRFCAEVTAARATAAGLPAPDLLGRHFDYELRRLQTAYLLGDSRVLPASQLMDLRVRVERMAADQPLRQYVLARVKLADAENSFSDPNVALLAKEYLDDRILSYADPSYSADPPGHVRHTLARLADSFTGLAKDKESQSFLGEAQELTQRLDADRESQRDNRAYGSFDTQLQELVAQFILLRREERPRLRSQFELLRAESLAHRPLRESYRQPTFVSVDQDAHQAIVLQIGAGPTVPLASLRPEIAGGPVKLPGAWSDYAGQTLLVDVRTLDFQRYQELVGALVTARQQGLKVNFCFQRSPQSQAHFQVFPDWLSVRVLGDSTHFKTFPAHVRQISVDWLHELASAWDSVQKQDLKSNRAEFVVDHFDQEGHSLQALKQRIQRGDLRAAYALALLGDSKRESLQAFLELADLAVREGQAEMFSFPIEALPAPVAPLVVDAMLDSFRTPVATPLELPTRACQDVRRRLERCLLEHDPAAMQEALRSALPSRTKRDPVDLFRDRSGEFQPKVLKEMIEVLRRTEQGFITVTVNELASPTHFRC